MIVKVNLFTVLKKYGKGKIGADGRVSLPDNSSLQDLISYLEIPGKKGKILLVNGMPRDGEYMLKEGDAVKILSFIGGG